MRFFLVLMLSLVGCVDLKSDSVKEYEQLKENALIKTHRYIGINAKRLNVDGVDCIVFYGEYEAQSVAVDCNWKE